MKLSTGITVVLKKHYTHRAEREYQAALMKGVTFRTEIQRDAEGNAIVDPQTGDFKERTVTEGLSVENTAKANEKLIECLIESINDEEGHAIEFSEKWLGDLPQADYKMIEDAALAMKTATDDLKPKKDDDEKKRTSESKK